MLPIVLAKFPYLDTEISKLRPCLVIANQPFQNYTVLVLAYISSKKPLEFQKSDLEINFEQNTGLKRNSYVRLHKLLSLDETEIQGQIGFVDDQIHQGIKTKLKDFFDL